LKKIQIIYIISKIDKSLPFEWLALAMQKLAYDIHFVLLNEKESTLELFLKKHHISVERINYRNKKDGLRVLWNLYKIIQKKRPQIIHTHLFDAGFWGIIISWLLQVPKRIHTRHYAALQHHYYPKGVIYDKMINYFSTDIIAPSPAVETVLIALEKVNKNKIHSIPHGFNLENFENPIQEKVLKLNEKYKTTNHFPIVGVVARYIHLKGIQYIIPAFQKLLQAFPQAKLILAGAYGDYASEIKIQLEENIPKENYLEIEFENDLVSLYQLFDFYMHVPLEKLSEAFGQTYIEALAAGVPSIFTLSGIAPAFIKDQENALVVPSKNSEAIYNALKSLIEKPDLQQKLIEKGKKSIEQFKLENHIKALDKLYNS